MNAPLEQIAEQLRAAQADVTECLEALDAEHTVSCSQCGQEFTGRRAYGYSHCENHPPYRKAHPSPYVDKLETRIAGIPCLIGVLSYGRPAYISGAPENCDPGDCAEYDVLDARGRYAPWLARKVTDDEDARIQELIESVRSDWSYR